MYSIRKFTIRKIIVLGCMLLFSVACNDDKQPEEEALQGHLSADLVKRPSSIVGKTDTSVQLGKLVFKDTMHDFGNVKEGEMLAYEFEFENKGQKDLLISDAKASCGCTAADFPSQPIKANEKNRIKVTFDSQGRKGINDKGVTVSTNGSPSVYYLLIKANVN